MKKFFVCLISVITALLIAILGCGCTVVNPLTFSSAFAGENNDPSSYLEEAVYDVKYTDNYQNLLIKDSTLDNYVEINFSNGRYKTTLETIDKTTFDSLNIETDILTELPENASTIYKYTTNLEITASYYDKADKKTYEHTDTIETKTFFCSYRLSYSPIYSKTESSYSSLAISGGVVVVATGESVCETVYKKTSYTLNEKYYQRIDNDRFLLDEKTTTIEYDHKTVVDNTQLLFILRNIDVAQESYYGLPTVSYQYGDAKILACKNTNFSSKPYTFNYCGEDKNLELTVRNYSITLSNGLNTGLPQFATVMKEKTNDIKQVLTLSYVQPLVCYGTMFCMGALEYKLTSFSVTK